MDATSTVGALAPGPAAANAPPLKDERPSGQVEAFKGQEGANSPNFTDIAAKHKADALLIEKAAMEVVVAAKCNVIPLKRAASMFLIAAEPAGIKLVPAKSRQRNRPACFCITRIKTYCPACASTLNLVRPDPAWLANERQRLIERAKP